MRESPTGDPVNPDAPAYPTPPAFAGELGKIDQLAAVIHGWPERPSWDEYFMATAVLLSSRSPCERLRVGCVVVSGGTHRYRIIAGGYNGFLPGAPHVSRVRDHHEQSTVHAEQNAVADAARRGVSVQDGTAYVTHFPCINCAKILAAAGVRHVKYHWDYKNDPLVREIFAEVGVSLTKL